MYKTRIDIPAKTRTKVNRLLQSSLADAVDLFTQIKQAHWNVKGPTFIALHELFDRIAEDVEEHGDLLAERITALGGRADGTARVAAGRWGWPQRFLSDNASVYKHTLAAAVGALGVDHRHGRPEHPQTQGKVERLHQTLQKWLRAQPGVDTLDQLTAILRNRLKSIQYRPELIPGFLAQTGLSLDPEAP